MFRDCVGKCTENMCYVVEFKCAHVHIHDSLIKYFAKFLEVFFISGSRIT